MLSKEDIDGLPDDPEEAFAALADLFEAYVADHGQGRNGIASDDAIGCCEEIQAIISALGAEDDYSRLMKNPPRDDGTGEFWWWWGDFQGAMRHYKARALMLRRRSMMSVVLDRSHRAKNSGVTQPSPRYRLEAQSHPGKAREDLRLDLKAGE